MRAYLLILLLLLLPLPTLADASPEQSFNAIIAHCITTTDKSCRNHFTASSYSLYDRFTSYGLMRCVPKDAHFISTIPGATHTILRAATGSPGHERVMRLAFKPDGDDWKLDVPESLRIGMGENWQKQVDTTEQIYLVLRAQFGGELNCQAVQALAK
jgi:hypothetical protein